jgi:hypothetical protein
MSPREGAILRLAFFSGSKGRVLSEGNFYFWQCPTLEPPCRAEFALE